MYQRGLDLWMKQEGLAVTTGFDLYADFSLETSREVSE